MQVQNVWPVNNNGDILLSRKSGPQKVAGLIGGNYVSSDSTNTVSVAGIAPTRNLEVPIVQATSVSVPRYTEMTAGLLSGATVVLDNTLFGGKGGMTITPTSASPVVKYKLNTVLDFSNTPTIQLVYSTNSQMGSDKFLLICYFTNDLASNWAIFNVELRGSPLGKDISISIDKSVRSNQSAGYTDSLWSNVTGFAITQTSQVVDANNYFSVSNISTGRRYTPSVFLSMDHGFNGQMQLAIPTLEKYGLKGEATIFLRKDVLGGGGVYTDLPTIQSAAAAGYPIGMHSYSVPFDTTNLTNFPDAASITNEILGFHKWAASVGINTQKNVQPIAVSDPFIGVLTQAQIMSRTQGYFNAGVKRLRRGNQAYNATKANNDGFLKGSIIHTYPLVAATTNGNIDTWLQKAIDSTELISIYWHNVLATGATANDCNLAQLDYLCQRIAYYRGVGMMNVAHPDDLV